MKTRLYYHTIITIGYAAKRTSNKVDPRDVSSTLVNVLIVTVVIQ